MPEPIWTKDWPKVEGWYWFRDGDSGWQGDSEPEVVRAVMVGSSMMIAVAGPQSLINAISWTFRYERDCPNALWGPRIHEPAPDDMAKARACIKMRALGEKAGGMLTDWRERGLIDD